MQNKKNAPLLKATLLTLLCVGTSILWATTLDGKGSDISALETADLYAFLKNNVLTNMRYITGICAFIFTTVACFSQNMSSVIMNNLAFVCYVVFGGAIFIRIIESQGLLLPLMA